MAALEWGCGSLHAFYDLPRQEQARMIAVLRAKTLIEAWKNTEDE